MNFEFKFTLDEVNLILSSLAKRPFEEVAGIVFKIKQSAEQQIAANSEEKPKEGENASQL